MHQNHLPLNHIIKKKLRKSNDTINLNGLIDHYCSCFSDVSFLLPNGWGTTEGNVYISSQA